MATTPCTCPPIHPAVTHTLTWDVQGTPHTSDNFQVRYGKNPDYVGALAKFANWLTSNGVINSPTVASDRATRYGTWFNGNYESPVYETCSYSFGGYAGSLKIDTKQTQYFQNLKPYQYSGNTSEGFIVIDYNNTETWQPMYKFVLHCLPFFTAYNAIRAVVNVDATIARAYPVTTRVIAAPPTPLVEDAIGDLNENITLNGSFKPYIEYQGQDRSTSIFINSDTKMGFKATGKNEAKTNNIDSAYTYISIYDDQIFNAFFKGSADVSQVLEGEYKILTYPLLQSSAGTLTYNWPDAQENEISASGFNAVTQYSHFYSTEAYLHNHIWNVKFIRYVATKFELTTIPPQNQKITEFTHWIETIKTPNEYYPAQMSNEFFHDYKLHVTYKSTTAKEVVRTQDTMAAPPILETVPREQEFPWTGDYYSDVPSPVQVGSNEILNLLPMDNAIVNLETGEQIDYWGGPGQSTNSFSYKIKIYYENMGAYQPEGLEKTGFVEYDYDKKISGYPSGAKDEDAPDPIPENLVAIILNIVDNKFVIYKYKAFGIYEDGSHVKDYEMSKELFSIDCTPIGGKNPSVLADVITYYKTTMPWDDIVMDIAT